MKKWISVILCVALLFSSVAIGVCAADDTLPFIAATDLHYIRTPKTAPNNYPGETYYTGSTTATLGAETRAIIRQFLREAAESDAKFILLSGDLTDNGALSEHRDVAKLLANFERETGKKVFVIDGNHDFGSGTTVSQFRDIYAEFGYTEALAVDNMTCSYTADLDGRYRLLAFDSCDHTAGGDGINDELLDWAKRQAEQAKKDGKTLIAIMHHNFLEHIKMESKLLPAFIVRPSVDLKTHLLDWGVRYVFTGHLHGHDVIEYTDKAGHKVYDIMTTSLSGYPCAYRICSLSSEGLRLDTIRMHGVDAADLPQSGYTQRLLDELTGDLQSYAFGCFRNVFESRKDSFFGAEALRDILSRFGGATVQNLIDACYPAFYANITLPIYAEDAQDGRSLQTIAQKLGLHFPTCERTSVSDSLFYFITVMYDGDENVAYNDDEIVLFLQCVYTALYDAMKTVRTDQRERLLEDVRYNFKDAVLPLTVSSMVKTALGTVKDDRLLETTLLLMAPLIEMYSVDDAPADNDVFLPDTDDAPQTFFTLVRQIWQALMHFLRRYFRGIGSIYFRKKTV